MNRHCTTCTVGSGNIVRYITHTQMGGSGLLGYSGFLGAAPDAKLPDVNPMKKGSVVSITSETCLFCGDPSCDGINCEQRRVESKKYKDEPWNDPARMDAWFLNTIRVNR